MQRCYDSYLRWGRAWKLLVSCLLALFCCLCAFPLQPSAQANTVSTGPSIQIDIGFDKAYRLAAWTPAIVTLNNNGAPFKGTLTVNIYTGPPNSAFIAQIAPWSFERPVLLPRGAHQQITLYLPFNFSGYIPRGFVANLLDSRGQVVAAQISPNGYNVQPNDLLVGLLSSPDTNFAALNAGSLPNQTSSLTTSSLNAITLPSTSSALEMFDVIILDNFASKTLSPAQLAALQDWVNQGGRLIEVGGDYWQSTLGALPPALLPVTLTGTDILPPGTPVLPMNGSTPQATDATLKDPLVISTAAVHNQGDFSQTHILARTDTTPLIVEAQQGSGSICYLAYDPGTLPLANWPGTANLWSTLLLHTLGDRLLIPGAARGYASGPGQLLAHGGVLTMIEPQTLPGPWILGLLLLCYIAMIGPLRLLIIKRWNLPRWWGWRIFLGSVIFFSLFAYGLASFLQGAAFTNDSIALIQFNQNGSSVHITNYMGAFVPTPGNLRMHVASETLIQPLDSQLLANSYLPFVEDDPPATIVEDTGGTTLTLHDLNQWTFHPIITQQDHSLQGRIIPHLALSNTALTGTITNSLHTGLSDAYLLFSHGFVHIGHLAAGETYHLNASLATALYQSGRPLAEQIALRSGLPAGYFPYRYNQQPQSSFQRHIALLSALNGEGFSFPPCNGSCATHAIIDRQAIFPTGGGLISTNANSLNYDPLLLPDAPVTLIGWADTQLAGENDVQINDGQANGYHESFLQMPMTLDTSAAGGIPANFISKRVIDIESYSAEALLPGIYTLADGSITFELTAPRTGIPGGMSITVPDLLNQHTGISGIPLVPPGTSHIQAHLYNWLTHRWDLITLVQNTYRTTDAEAYSGPDGQVLLQIGNQERAQIYFGAPSMQTFPLS